MDLSFESISSLNPFAEVSRRLGIRLTLRGGLVRRLVRTAIYEASELDSDDLLFRLTPFASDIDVEHSGQSDLSARIREELLGSVPAAASIRLEIRSEWESYIFGRARRFQAFAPVLSMSLSSDGFRDPEGGTLDIARRRYRFSRNELYQHSILYRRKRDLEIFSMLLFLKAVLEDGASPPENFLGELEKVRSGMEVSEGGYLDARLFYLLAGIWGVSHRTEENSGLLRATGLKLSFREANTTDARVFSLAEIVDSKGALIVSSWLGAEHFRFPKFTRAPFLRPSERTESAVQIRQCASDQECFLESSWLDVSQGISDSVTKQTPFGMEFVHLLLGLPHDCEGLSEREITACWLLKGMSRHDDEDEELVLPAPTVCHVLTQNKKEKLSVRCNLLDLGGLVGAFRSVQAKIFLLLSHKTKKKPSLLAFTTATGGSPRTLEHFVYVHGIRSEPSTFDSLRTRLEREGKARGLSITHHGFSYPYKDSMKSNGTALAAELTGIGARDRSVTLFGHSMGGLISRLAILDQTPAYKLIKRVVMFGTPNHGAVRASSMTSLLMWILHRGAVIGGDWLRGPGILELTEVHNVFKDPMKRRDQADGIEYITIPGTFFNKSRHQLDLGGLPKMTRALGIATLLLRFAYSPSKPHDGIVERESVDLLPAEAGRRSEKNGPPLRFSDPGIEYVHVHLPVCDSLDHLTVHTNDEVFEFVVELVFKKRLSDLAGSKFENDVWPLR